MQTSSMTRLGMTIMNCDRCPGEMVVGQAIPSTREDARLAFPYAACHPIVLETVLKCRECGRSLSREELMDRAFMLRIARSAAEVRKKPGEDLTGLSDQEFLDRLFGGKK